MTTPALRRRLASAEKTFHWHQEVASRAQARAAYIKEFGWSRIVGIVATLMDAGAIPPIRPIPSCAPSHKWGDECAPCAEWYEKVQQAVQLLEDRKREAARAREEALLEAEASEAAAARD